MYLLAVYEDFTNIKIVNISTFYTADLLNPEYEWLKSWICIFDHHLTPSNCPCCHQAEGPPQHCPLPLTQPTVPTRSEMPWPYQKHLWGFFGLGETCLRRSTSQHCRSNMRGMQPTSGQSICWRGERSDKNMQTSPCGSVSLVSTEPAESHLTSEWDGSASWWQGVSIALGGFDEIRNFEQRLQSMVTCWLETPAGERYPVDDAVQEIHVGSHLQHAGFLTLSFRPARRRHHRLCTQIQFFPPWSLSSVLCGQACWKRLSLFMFP